MANEVKNDIKVVKGVLPGVIIGTLFVLTIAFIGRKATERKK